MNLKDKANKKSIRDKLQNLIYLIINPFVRFLIKMGFTPNTVTLIGFLLNIGVAIIFISHFIVHVGMNIGALPVTGLTLPFMSYGGSSTLIAFAALGILMSMRRYSRAAHKDVQKNEYVGF